MLAKQMNRWTPEQPRQSWLAVTLQILGVTVVSGAIVYLATDPERIAEVAKPALAQAAAPHISAPSPPT